MVSGRRFRVVGDEEARARWDGWAALLPEASIRQSFAWGESKRPAWTPTRCGLFDGDRPLTLASVLERRAPLGLASVAWANAGPLFASAPDLAEFLASLKGLWGRGTLLRLGPRTPRADGPAEVLSAAGFRPSWAPLDSGLTSVVDLGPPEAELRARLDRKWRNQLKKGESARPTVSFGRDAALRERYHALHEALCRRKSLAAERMSLDALGAAAAAFGESLTFAVASADGTDGAGACWWTFAGRATLWLSAANDAGLAACLPNALYWAVVTRLKADGALSFDLAGLDPVENPGVTRFKRGLGGAEVETLGEWDWSSGALTRTALSAALKAVRGRLPR